MTAVVAAFSVVAVSALRASAQTTSDFTTNIDPLFQGVLVRPANFDNTVLYAQSAARAGDIESAISTYEQLLFYNPKLSQTRYILGVLYYRLGSWTTARGYLHTALQMADITPQLRQQVEDLLELVDKKLQPDQFSGFAQTGLRYQSNATQGPGPQTALASGQSFNNRFFAKPDFNWFGSFGLNYVHDFHSPSGTTFEGSLLGYDAQQFTQHQVDVGLLEIRAGPRFALSPGDVNGVTVKPYLVTTGALLADTAYMGSLGGGLTIHAMAGNVSLDPYAEIVHQSFVNSTLYPLASGMSGTLQTYGVRASGPLWSGLSWQARGVYTHASDQFAFDSYNGFAGDVWLPWLFSIWGNQPWTLVPTFGMSYWRYGAPDPNIAPLTTAQTTEWRAGLGLEIPIWKKLTLGTLVLYRDDVSNVAAFALRDLSITVGPTIRF
jgi:hypothetical protein